MDAREKIMQLHNKYGLECAMFNTGTKTHSLEADCNAVIKGLEESSENLNDILTMNDTNAARWYFCVELAFMAKQISEILLDNLLNMA